ncbi:hypothetical protein ACFQGT_06265 [Natrialbaceae archaeon GCM10025810]|uniref:hypothetical protein n=1 Tax=Halovalidus salilacus TaxID=3075124 RepID=UPI003620AABF
MKTPVMRLVLIGVLVVALVGAVSIVSADTNENVTADDEVGYMGQMADHMSDHTPGEHHDGDNAEHHAEHADQHAEHHPDGNHC